MSRNVLGMTSGNCCFGVEVTKSSRNAGESQAISLVKGGRSRKGNFQLFFDIVRVKKRGREVATGKDRKKNLAFHHANHRKATVFQRVFFFSIE